MKWRTNNSNYYAKLTCYPISQWGQQDMDRFGGALDSAEDAGLMIVGDEFSEIDGYDRRKHLG